MPEKSKQNQAGDYRVGIVPNSVHPVRSKSRERGVNRSMMAHAGQMAL